MADKVRITSLMSVKRLDFGLKMRALKEIVGSVMSDSLRPCGL